MSSLARLQWLQEHRVRQRRLAYWLRILLGVVAIGYALFPVVWVASASLNPANSLFSASLIPRNASLINFERLLANPDFPFLRWMWNSIKVASVSSILGVLFTSLAAYAFSRFRFRGRRTMLQTILLIQVFPNLLAIVALFLLVRQIGDYIPWLGLNTHGGLILVYLGGVLGFNTWLMKGFFDSIPRDLDESAMMDGASHWQSFWYVILPLVRPILAVVGMLTFIGTYGDFILASVMLRSSENFTLGVGLTLLIGRQYAERWGEFAAGALIGALPIVVIWLLLQDFVVGGLTRGAVKG